MTTVNTAQNPKTDTVKMLEAAAILFKLGTRGNAVRARILETVHDLLHQSAFGTKPAEVRYQDRFDPNSGNSKEIKDRFETLTMRVGLELDDLFCTSGRCYAADHTYDTEKNIESCVFRFEPKSPPSPS